MGKKEDGKRRTKEERALEGIGNCKKDIFVAQIITKDEKNWTEGVLEDIEEYFEKRKKGQESGLEDPEMALYRIEGMMIRDILPSLKRIIHIMEQSEQRLAVTVQKINLIEEYVDAWD